MSDYLYRLARALYRTADLYLLDDPLSAVCIRCALPYTAVVTAATRVLYDAHTHWLINS